MLLPEHRPVKQALQGWHLGLVPWLRYTLEATTGHDAPARELAGLNRRLGRAYHPERAALVADHSRTNLLDDARHAPLLAGVDPAPVPVLGAQHARVLDPHLVRERAARLGVPDD